MRRVITVCLILASVTLAAYWPVFRNSFVSYDDPSYVTENPHVLKGVNSADLEWAFKTNQAGNWHPLTWASHMLDVSLFGLQPAGHHFTSLLLHTVNTILLFLLLRAMTGTWWRSSAVAALFALHPVHVESVAWVAERKDVLSTFFLLLTLLAYLHYVHALSPPAKTSAALRWYLLAAFFFACGLMSKPMLVTLPFVLLLLDFWPLQRLQHTTLGPQRSTLSRMVWEKIPLFALSAASCVVTFIVQRGAGAVNSLETVPLELRLSNALISYVRYLGKTLWPENLAVFYPLPREWPLEWAVAAAVLLLSLTGVVLWRLRRAPYLAAGWFWFLGTLTPVVGFVQVGQQAMADRYTYIPLIGIFVMIVWSLAEIPLRRPATRPWLAVGGAVIVAGCGLVTWRQLAVWRDSRALFEHALLVTRDNPVAHNNLGAVLLGTKDFANAEIHFNEAVRIHANYPEALANLALCRERQGQADEAIGLYQRALQGRDSAVLHFNLGNLLAKQGKLPEAEAEYLAALKLQSEFADAWFNLGNVHARQGREEEAKKDFATALRLKPGNAGAYLTLGASLAGEKKFDEAIVEFKNALRVDPNNADAHFNLASALQAKGDFPGATVEFKETCRLRPDDIDARRALGFALLCQGRMAEAAPQFEQILQAGSEPAANYYLALALDTQGQMQAAATRYREALRLAPNAAAYMNDLAWLLATCPDDTVRNGAEAVRLAEEATRLSGGKEVRFLGTLDAAYAESGRFDEAIAAATKTRDLAVAAKQPEIARHAEERLALYRQHQPFRRPLQPPAAK